MNLKNIKPVGGFYRYGLSLYLMSQHDLDAFGVIAVNLQSIGIHAASTRVLAIAKVHCGGHNLKLGEIVIQDGLIVFHDIDRSWQVAFGENFDRYMKWLRLDNVFTADQYERELRRKPYEPHEQEDPDIN
jgi:hypothetical protein